MQHHAQCAFENAADYKGRYAVLNISNLCCPSSEHFRDHVVSISLAIQAIFASLHSRTIGQIDFGI